MFIILKYVTQINSYNNNLNIIKNFVLFSWKVELIVDCTAGLIINLKYIKIVIKCQLEIFIYDIRNEYLFKLNILIFIMALNRL